MKKVFPAIVLALALVLTAAPAHAAGLSIFSGRTLGTGSALNISAGLPDISMTWANAWSADSDLDGWLRFGYLSPIYLHGDTLWLTFGGTYKKNIRNYGKYNLGLKLDFGPFMFFREAIGPGYRNDTFNPGILFGPGMIFGIPLKDIAILNLGLNIPVILTFRDEVTARIPIGFMIGTEIFIDPALSVNLNFEVGPGVVATGNGSDADVYALFKVGVTFGL